MAEKKATAKRVDLKVSVDNHTHKGKLCKKDSTIQVTAEQASFLKGLWKKQGDK